MSKKKMSAEDEERYQKALGDLHGEGLATVTNKDEGFEYFLAAQDPEHPHSVERMQDLGLEVVGRESNSGEFMPRAIVKSGEDGVIRTRDMVLMRYPKEVAEYRRQFLIQEAVGRSKAYNEELEESVAQAEGASGTSNKTYHFMGSN